MTILKIWLDDDHNGMRPKPEDYTHHVHNMAEFQALLEQGFDEIEKMSFDNDLGEPIEGKHIMKWLSDRVMETGDLKWWPKRIRIHSHNEIAKWDMKALIRNFHETVIDRFDEWKEETGFTTK